MKKILYVVLGLIVVLILAALIAPFFFNLNSYRADIQNEFKAGTGYNLNLKGDIDISLFPVVKAYTKNISISNNSKNLVDVEEIVAYPQLSELIAGRLKIASVKIIKPDVLLEKNEGGNSWDKLAPKAGDNAAAPVVPATPAVPKSVALKIDDIKVLEGKVDYKDNLKSKEYLFQDINLTASLESLNGPLNFDAALKYKNLPVKAKGRLDQFDNLKISLNSNIMGSEFTYNGAPEAGKLTAKSADIAPLAEFLNIKYISQLNKLPVDIAADISYSAQKVDLKNISFAVGDTKGAGDISAAVDGKIDATVNMKFSNINLDQMMPNSADFAKPVVDPNAPAEKKASAENNTAEMNIGPQDISANLDIASASVVFGGEVYKNLMLQATSENGEVVVQPFSIEFPGSGHGELYGILSKDTEGHVFEGHIDANSNNLRNILKSFKVDLSGVKKEPLNKMAFDTDFVLNVRDKVTSYLSNTVLAVDDSNFNGNISLSFEDMPVVDFNGTIDKLNLDTYVEKTEIANVENIPAKQKAPVDDRPLRITALEKLPIRGSADISLAAFTFNNELFSGSRLKAKFKPQQLEVEELTTASPRIQLAARGSIEAYPDMRPKMNFSGNFGKINVADFVKQDDKAKADAPPPQNKSRWSEVPYNFNILRKVDLDFSANINSLKYNKFVLDNITIKAYSDSGKLVVEKSAADIFGGTVVLTANVIAGAVPSLGIAFNATDIDANKLLDAVFRNKRVQGKLTFNGSLATSGIYELAMISNLKGGVSVSSNSLVVKGFDLEGLMQQITNINDVSGVVGVARTVSGEDAVTYLKSLTGSVVVEGGIARTQRDGIAVDAGVAKGSYGGMADLLNWNMDTNANFKLETEDPKRKPSIIVHIYGPLDDPNKDINLDDVKRFIADRATRLILKNGGKPVSDDITPDAAPAPAVQTAPAAQQPAAKVARPSRSVLPQMRVRSAQRRVIMIQDKSDPNQLVAPSAQ